MKKSFIKTCLLLCFILIASVCVSCDKKCKNHDYVNGVCVKCEANDPGYVKPHMHNYVDGVCYCGEKDPDYVEPHTHNYVDGVCSCGEKEPNYQVQPQKYNIRFELNEGAVSGAPTEYDGTVTVVLPIPTKDNFEFGGWYDNPEFSGTPITEIPAGSKGDKVLYAKWCYKHECNFGNPNEIGFDGNGMSFGIKVPTLSNYDPFDEKYIFEDKALKQAHHKYIETAYNINISYIDFSNEAPWGSARVQYIKTSFIDNSFMKKNIYSVVINSSWIPSLVKAQCLVELYNINEEDGLFNEVHIDQDYVVNQLVSVRNKVYGYNTKTIQPEFLIYYNVDKVKELGLEDPTELWFKGEWNYSKFDSWVKDAQMKLSDGEYVIDSLHGDYAIGMTAAQGNKICDIYRERVLFAKNAVCSVLEKMKEYYTNGIWNKKKGLQDITNKFKEGSSLLQNGRLYFYTNGIFDDLGFNLGVVPYPSYDNTEVSLYLEPYEYENQNKDKIVVDSPLKKRNGEVLTTSDGEEIYGINLSKSEYNCPITSVDECYAIMNYNYEEIGIINENAILNILSDLTNYSYSEIENSYYDDMYDKYYSDIDKAAIDSLINGAYVYYEPIETIDYSIKGGCFGPLSWWILCAQVMDSDKTPKEFLDEYKNGYQDELENIYKN